jgi:hypothetical protein
VNHNESFNKNVAYDMVASVDFLFSAQFVSMNSVTESVCFPLLEIQCITGASSSALFGGYFFSEISDFTQNGDCCGGTDFKNFSRGEYCHIYS